jgi:hypothetical protein
MAKRPPIVWWMDAQQYAKLSKDQKDAVATAISTYEQAEAVSRETMTMDIATAIGDNRLL